MSGKGYPTQPPYPTQPSYPIQPSAGYPQQYQQQPMLPQGYSVGVQPQAYSQTMQPPPYAAAPPQPPPYTPVAQNPMPEQYGGHIPGPAMYHQPPQQAVHMGAIFDNGCRFDGIAQPNIPPPPPGCLPNRAQMAASQGHIVQGTQRNTGLFDGGSGGGFTW